MDDVDSVITIFSPRVLVRAVIQSKKKNERKKNAIAMRNLAALLETPAESADALSVRAAKQYWHMYAFCVLSTLSIVVARARKHSTTSAD